MFKNIEYVQKVIVGISGGVDSAVAALLLKSKGFKVTGIFMRNWDIVNELGECQAEKDYEDAKWICNRLKIPLHDVNFVKDYWNEVFSYLLENYEVGKTPNPDIQCNKKIKFNKFFHYARTELGADAIATGHYARNSFGSFLEDYKPDTNASLLRAKDSLKRSDIFLITNTTVIIKEDNVSTRRILEERCKKMAKEANLEILANKKESMGICFIGSRQFQDFIVEYVEEKPGYFIDFKTGNIVGKHTGIHQWTLGQGCKIGGLPSPYFVFRKDTDNNNIYVVAGSSHPALFSEFLVASNVHWINEEPLELKNRKVYDCDFRFQHRNILVPCSVFKTTSNKLLIRLYKPKRAITPGQYAVLYAGEQCLGSAEITSSGPPFEFLNRDVNDIDVTDPTQVQALQS